MNTRGNLALAQITLLIFGILAFGWILGSEVKMVSGAGVPASLEYYKVTFPNGETGTYSKSGNFYTKDKGSGPDGFQMDGRRIISSDGSEIKSISMEKATTPSDPAAAIPAGLQTASQAQNLLGDKSPAASTLPTTSIQRFDDGSTLTLNPDGTIIDTPATDGTGAILNAAGKTPTNWDPIWSSLGKGLTWSLVVVGLIQIIGPMAGWSSAQTNAASAAAFGGIMAGQLVYGALGGGTSAAGAQTLGITSAGWWGLGTGVVVGATIFYLMWKDESTETVSFTCEQWQAPTGGNMCEQCNKQGILPCSEYQCRSLGQSCELINKGTTNEKCTWINRNDVTPPVISLWKDALSKNHRYAPDNRVSPPDTGTKIIYEQSSKDGCIKAFTPLEFGVLTNEPASCKLDYQKKNSFDNMTYYFGGTSAFLYNHSQVMSLPGAGNLTGENITMKNNGEYSIFIRCADSNGNKNVANFVFRFCVDKGPDTTPPLIVATNLLNNMPIAYNKSKLDLEVYTNEPANCRWSHLNQNYEKMEQKMTCSSSVLEMNAQMLYKCKTQLNGIKNEMENNFYIRCEDQPLAQESSRNRNKESYTFTVIGTKPLVINYVGPNGTIMDSTETVKVTLGAKTLGGYQEGNSTCYYSTAEDTEGIMFFETNSYIHSQELWLPEGTYTYSIKCVDLGGNADTKETSFKVKTDTQSPIVVRAYNEESNLKIITDEPSECVYGINDCVYEVKDGIKMSSIDDNQTQHYTSWDTSKTFYIKCQDKYGTAPYPNQCSIILRPSEQVTVQD